MRKRVIILLYLGLVSGCLPAQLLTRPATSAYTSQGVYSLRHNDIFSFTCNQAALARLQQVSAGLYTERRFMLGQLNNYTLVAACPGASGNFGLSIGYFGLSDYAETHLGIAYGRKLNESVDIGTRFSYHNVRVTGYGKAAATSFEIGMINHLSAKLHTAIHINNPVGGKFGNELREKLPSVYTLGIGYEASEKLLFASEIIKEENQPLNVNAGFHYWFLPQAMIRAGVSTAVSSWWAGVGLSKRMMRINLVSAYHPQLGISPGLLIQFNLKEKKLGKE